MTPAIDETHDPARRSWVVSANGHADFPIQNLPIGVFSLGDGAPSGGVAIGDAILDIAAAHRAGLFDGAPARAAEAAGASTLNGFMALGVTAREAFRRRVSRLLSEGAVERAAVEPLLHSASECAMHLPAAIGDYTDFYAGIHHALNVGRQFRPDNPLLPNYKYVPIGYHGRSSSIVPSGTPVTRPQGQRKGPNDEAPTFGLAMRLDFELELGVWIGPGNTMGQAIPIGEAPQHIAGFCLVNDWSARDLQAWEYQPLGPFLAKNFATSVSPWVVMPEALAPFRVAQPPRPDGDPAPLPYLLDSADQQSGALAISLEVSMTTSRSREAGDTPARISHSNARHIYWTVAQMLTHHASNGCNLRPGDLLGSGTISADTADGLGSLLEMTQGGRVPLAIGDESRTFLLDGDEIIIRARAERDGFVSIGFGEVRGRIAGA